MKILVIRHGQTDWNVERRMQGRTDVPLNKEGKKQAYEAKQKLKDEKIEWIVSSPLKRAIETTEIINEGRAIPTTFDERLIEISYGKMEGKFSDEVKNRTEFGNVVNGILYEGAESSEDFKKRIFDFLEDLIKSQVNTVLLVTHKEVCKAIAIYFEGIKKEKENKGKDMSNCEVISYEI